MTGRRLYDLACSARRENPRSSWENVPQHVGAGPWLAWTFLHRADRDFWNSLARASTPRRRSR